MLQITPARVAALLFAGILYHSPILQFSVSAQNPPAKPASKPASAPAQPADLDELETKKLVSRFRETEHWALKAIALVSLGPRWHPAGAAIVEESLEQKDLRLKAYAAEALLRCDVPCLHWVLTPDLVTAVIAQAQAAKNSYFQDRLLTILRTAFPEVKGKDTKTWKPAQWSQWWSEARAGYAVEPWPGAAPRPKSLESEKSTTSVADRFVTRAVDLNIAGLDVAICIDSTGSMQPTINAARDGLAEIVSLLRALSPKFRLGLVHYKDKEDIKNGAKMLSPLTTQIADVQEMLNKLIAAGGGDIPEAVDAGLELALDASSLGWTPQANKVIVIIGDAPPHPENVAATVKLAKGAFEKPFGKDQVLTGDAKTIKNSNRPFVISTIAINGTPDTLSAFQQIAAAGGGMCATMAIAAAEGKGKNGGGGATRQGDATRGIVQHILTLTFGRALAAQTGIFVNIYQDYRRAEFFRD